MHVGLAGKIMKADLMNAMDSTIDVKRAKILEIVYIASSVLLLSAVVFTPFIIGHNLKLTEKIFIEEDVLEASLIVVLLSAAYTLSYLYKKEMNKYRHKIKRLVGDKCDLSDKLTDAFKYIGVVNVQIQEIRSIFSGPKRYPVTKCEFKKILVVFARKVIEITKAEWVVIRIIERDNFRTIKEQRESKKNNNFDDNRISNKAIISNQKIDGYNIVGSRQDNLMIKVVCILPDTGAGIGIAERILVEAIANQLEMLFIISTFFISPKKNLIKMKNMT
jgi:hypothetical protein